MIPLIPTLVFSIVSFVFSAFAILRALAPLVPENRIHPRKRSRVKKPGLPQPEKAHIWLAATDIFSVILFVWQVFEENPIQRSNGRAFENPPSVVRLHLVATLRQMCLLVIMTVTTLQIRQAKASSFGPLNSVFWFPVLFLAVVSSVASGVVASVGARSILYVTGTCMFTVAALNTMVMAFLVNTLKDIRRNLAAFDNTDGSWRDVIRTGKKFPREDIEALKEGCSWITSDSGSVRPSISSFSFGSTIEAGEQLPGNTVEQSGNNSCSQQENSCLTEPSVLPSTMPDWSFPTSRETEERLRNTVPLPISQNEQCLVIVRRAQPDSGYDLEKALNIPPQVLPKSVNVSWRRVAGWMSFIWIPSILAAPYVFLNSASELVSILFTLSVTMSAPMLAFNAAFGPLPIPTDLFGNFSDLPKPSEPTRRHRNSASVTLVEGRRSGDVWLSKGDAIYGKGRLSRATSYLSRTPKLALLPVKSVTNDQDMKREATTHHGPRYDSAATSTFVAINAYFANELGCLPDGEVFSGAQNAHERRASIPKSYSTLSQCPGLSSSGSRRSSASSRSSSASKPNRNNFTSNLGTIPDISMSPPLRHTNSACLMGGNLYLFPRTESPSPSELRAVGPFTNALVPPLAHMREANIVYERGASANHEQSVGDDSSISEAPGVPFPSSLVRAASDRSSIVSRFGPP